jgi:hypothetical protein
MPDYKYYQNWGYPRYRNGHPNQTYDVRITKENLPHRTVRLTTYVGTRPVCTVIDKGSPGVPGTPFLERQGGTSKCEPVD